MCCLLSFVKIRMSVCEVKSLELYENGLPKEGGLNDPRMGTTDYRITCASCNMDCKQCPGTYFFLLYLILADLIMRHLSILLKNGSKFSWRVHSLGCMILYCG